MFYHIKIPKSNNGYPSTQLQHLIDQRLDFTPGVNVLFGPNGSGKTTVLKLLNQYCGNHYFNSDVPNRDRRGKVLNLLEIPHRDKSFPKGFFDDDCGHANVKWSGRAVLYLAGTESFLPPDSIESMSDFDKHFRLKSMSTGELSGFQLNEFSNEVLELNKTKDVWPEIDLERMNDNWRSIQVQWREFISKNRKKHPNPPSCLTLMMDEPEIGLDIVTQAVFYREMLQLSERAKIQIIITSHSAFTLQPEFNIISTSPKKNYVEDCRKALQEMICS